MIRTILTVAFSLTTIITCLGQTSYKGLTPGKSTRVAAQSVLGMHTKKYSDTLAEYRAQALTSKVLIQYQADAPVIERIEFYCQTDNSMCDDFARTLRLKLGSVEAETVQGEKFKLFYGAPLYVVATGAMADVTSTSLPASRLGFYSPDLFDRELARAREAGEVTSIRSQIPAEATSEETTSSSDTSTSSTPIGASMGQAIAEINRNHDPAPPAQPAPQYDNLIARARASWTAQDHYNAIRFVQQAIAENSSRPEAFQHLGFYQLYGSKDFNGALESLRAAVARGGSAEFRVSHDHSGNFQSYCAASLWVSKTGVAMSGNETFNVSYADIKEAKANVLMGSNFGAFHIKIVQGNKSYNYNFAPTTLQLAESNIILSLILYH